MMRYLLPLGALLVASVAFAQESSITFPIAELGGCTSKQECHAYCDDSDHMQACIDFGESHGLMSAEEAARARALSTKTGPGGCVGIACKTYCSDLAHREECIAFAKENGLEGPPMERGDMHRPEITPEKEALILEKIREEGGPGGCTTKDECQAYCEDAEHAKECIAFGKAHGLMSEEEAERAEKFIGKAGPGGCMGEACREYCEDPSHQEECFAFAVENGFISKEEAARMQEFRSALEEGGPGGCMGEECREYCSDPAHHEECIAFAKEHGHRGPPTEGEEGEFDGARGMPPKGGFGGGNNVTCSSPEECKKLYESNPEGYAPVRMPDPSQMTDEERARFREMRTDGMMPPQGMNPEEMEKLREEWQSRQGSEGPRDFPRPPFPAGEHPEGAPMMQPPEGTSFPEREFMPIDMPSPGELGATVISAFLRLIGR